MFYDNHFFCSSPEVFVTPRVSPLHEVEHRQHGESKSPCEWLSSDNWEEAVSEGGCEEAILEATKLVARDPALAVGQIFFGDG